MKILGMGNALVDALVKIENDEILTSLGLLRGAMTLIDEQKYKEISQVLDSMEKHVVAGGSASNTIVGLASLGVETGFIGRIGNDIYGKFYKEDLEKHGVKSHLVCADEASGVASTFISKDGERTFGTYLGTSAKLNPDDLSVGMFKGYDLFYIEGYLVQSHSLIEKAVKLAKEAGLKVAIDLASFNVVEENIDFLLTIIPQYIDIIFSNEEEAKAMTGLEAEEAVSKMHEMSELVIVKVGERGAWVQKGCVKIQIPANKVTCVDATGAGDLYAAGFIYGLAKGKDLETCAKIGTLLAGEVIQVIGPKIPQDRGEYIKDEILSL